MPTSRRLKSKKTAQFFYLLFKGGGFLRSKKTEDCIRAIRESPLPARVIYANACDILLMQCDIFADGKSDIRLTASFALIHKNRKGRRPVQTIGLQFEL